MLHGEGRFQCEEVTWQGQFEHGDIVSGTMTYEDGYSYQGEFRGVCAPRPGGVGNR